MLIYTYLEILTQYLALYTIKDFGEIWDAKIEEASSNLYIVFISTYEVDMRIFYDNGVFIKIEDLRGVKLFDNGEYNANYLYIRNVSDNFGTFRDQTIEVIKSSLKTPSSAEFPGSFWDGYTNWTYGIKDNILTIASYVDAQNSFGAMIRTDYIVQYTFIGKDYSLTYFMFGDKESGEFK